MGTLSPPGRPGSRPGSWTSVATSPPWSEAWTREEGGGKLVYDLDTAEAMLKSRRHLYTPRAVPLARLPPPFPYQAIAARAARLDRLGMSASAIARRLGVTDKTVAKAIRSAAFPPTPPPASGRRSNRSSARRP